MSGSDRIIERYLGQATLKGFALVVFLLVMLFSLFELLVQMDSVGRGTYRMADAFVYAALMVPKRFADLTPMAGLLGSIVALGMFADHHELTAMQAAGISVRRIALTVLATSLVLMLAAVGISEYVAPPLEQYARTQRFQAIFGGNPVLTRNGFWVCHGRLFVHVGRVFGGTGVADVEVFEFDAADRLRQFVFAKQGIIQSGKDWVLLDAEVTLFGDDGAAQRTLAEFPIADFLSSSQLAILELPPDSQSLTELYAYVRILERRGQNAERHALAFWQKALLPVSTGALVLLSLTFIFGPTRMRNAWQRIFWGMLAGTLIYLVNQILAQLSLVFHLPPVLVTALPIGVTLAVAFRLLRRAG